MAVGGVDFYSQDQSYWSQSRAQSAASSAQASLINVIGSAMTNKAKGEASIANGIALRRVNSQLVAAVQAALDPNGSTTSSSGSSSNSASTSSSSSAAPAKPKPATGTGTVPMTTSTTLASLGILPGGQISISAGQHMTTYTSTGSDTVGDLMNFLNIDLPTNAQVTANLNTKGQLVITSRNTNDSIVVTGIYAGNIGFGATNNTFNPVKPKTTPSTTPPASTTSSTSSSTTTKSTKSSQKVLSAAQNSISSAGSLLSSSGVSGSLVDMLA